jgi:membrane associated rhomboid family serine protease
VCPLICSGAITQVLPVNFYLGPLGHLLLLVQPSVLLLETSKKIIVLLGFNIFTKSIFCFITLG